ncbi:potassium channel family protein [Streptomyces sp. NPDC085612]|uniref:potassium channel family protein n=1 Tax=Streptomyces sp. NPDC085612 TaxID=3365732 RepID=UPI0037D34F47
MERTGRWHHRRVLAGHLLRSAAAVALTTTAYYLAPLDHGFGALTVLTLLLGLVAFGLLALWQAGAITRAEYPRLRALEALCTAVPLFLILFSSTYYVLAANVPSSFNEPLNRTDALYFTMTVFATVGFGDIAATSETGRVLVTLQMGADLVVVGVIAKALFGAMKVGMRRRAGASRLPEDDP